MKIQINDHRKVFAIQEEFSKLFPNLKIEFQGKPNTLHEAATKKFVKGSKSLGECRVVHNKGELTLSPTMTVCDLQQSLNDTFGLAAIVFRKLGDKWIETSENGNLTISEQNQV